MPAQLLLTPALAESLADAVRRGVPIETATQAAGISHQAFYRWLRIADSGGRSDGAVVSDASLPIIVAFGEAIRRAEAEWEADHVQAISEAGAAVGKSGVPEWRARAFLLTNHPRTRERWGNKVTVEQTGTVYHEHQLVKTLEPAELEQAYEAIHALSQPNELPPLSG